MFNIGFSEMLAIGVIALVFIGPKQLPAIARTIGKILGEVRRATNEFTNTFTEIQEESNKIESGLRKEILETQEIIKEKQQEVVKQIDKIHDPK